jgi:thymidylate synthase
MFSHEADTASEIWSSAWAGLEANGSHRAHARGDYRELLHVMLSLRDPRQRWISTRSPAINPAFALAEVIWIVRGRSDAEFLVPWNRSLPKYSGTDATLHGAYGERLRSRFGFDQLERAADALSSSPEQRQVVLQIWDPSADFPTHDGHSRSKDIPCNVSSMLKVVDGRLEWLQVMRSNDIVRGLPYNVVQWTSLQEVLAGWMHLDLGSYVHVADSLHVYDRDRPAFGDRPQSPERASADLRLGASESSATFAALESAAWAMAKTENAEAIEAASFEIDSSSAYADWLSVLAAERMRRTGQRAKAVEFIERIRDPQLKLVTNRWHNEKSERLD